MRSVSGSRLRGFREKVIGKALDLLDVEHSIGFEEWDVMVDVLAVVVGVCACSSVGVDDGGAVLALPDMGVEFEHLLEGHPDRRGEAFIYRLGPEQT